LPFNMAGGRGHERMKDARSTPAEAGRGPASLGGKGMWFIYPFFGIHMLMFGLSGFLMAYSAKGPGLGFLYMHGGIAILVYMVFYLAIFGRDEVKWMLVNAGLGILGIYSQIGWLLAKFGKDIDDYPWPAHVVPFLYYILYTFLLRQFLLDLTRSRDNPARKKLVDAVYVVGSLIVYGGFLLRSR